MQCPICKNGVTRNGVATVTLERSGVTLIFREVPARICDTCGEAFHDEGVVTELLRRADEAAARGAEIEILRFAA